MEDIIKQQVITRLKEFIHDPSSILYRIICFILLGTFTAFYPVFLFVIYMWSNGFYSYEIIGEEFALKVFFWATILGLLFFGIILYFWLPVVMREIISQNINEKTSKQKLKLGVKVLWQYNLPIIISFLFATLLLLASYGSDSFTIFVAAVISSFVLILLLSSILFAPAKQYFITLSVTVMLSLAIPVMFKEEASSLFGNGLYRFKVGGVNVKIFEADKPASTIEKAKLVFLSPSYIYLNSLDDAGMIIVKRSDNIRIQYLNDTPEVGGIKDKSSNKAN